MRALPYPTRNCWRILVPPRFNGTHKSQAKYFKTKEEAEAAIEEIETAQEAPAVVHTDFSLWVLELIERRLSDIQSITLTADGDVRVEFQITQ